jgi:hypothetical protein
LSIIEIEIDKGRSTVHEILIEIDKLPRSDVAPRKTSHIYMNIHEPRPRAAAIYVDFNQDFMHSGTWSIGMAVLVPCRFQSRFLARKNQSGFLATERAVFVPLQDFRINLDFNQDFMHSGTGSIGIAVLVPLSISISISISISNRKIDIVEQALSISIRKIDIMEQCL